MNKKTLSIVNLVTLILMLVVNSISAFGLFGVTPVKDISDRLTNLLVPMGYTFSVIWTVIYAGLIYYTVKELVRKEDKYNIYSLFMVTNVLNVLWIVTFTLKMYLVSTIVIGLLLIILYSIMLRITDNNLDKIIFSVYTTWILVATAVSIESFIVSLGVTPFDSTLMKLVTIALVAASAILVLFNKNNMAMKITYIFSLIGIAANHIVKFNSAYLDLMVIVAIVTVYVLYSLLYELFSNSSKEVRHNEAI